MSQLTKPTRIKLTDNIKSKYLGTYNNDFTGKIIIEAHQDGIKVTYADNYVSVVQAQTENSFFIPNEDMRVEFNLDKKTNQMTMSFYENDFWSFDAWRLDSK